MNGLDFRIACKVTLDEGKNSLDAMDAHCRRQSRVVDLNAIGSLRHLGAVLIETFARETSGGKIRQTLRTFRH